MKYELVNSKKISRHEKEWPLACEYIDRDEMYRKYPWIHLMKDDDSNDAVAYFNDNHSEYKDTAWLSVFEVKNKGKGFGSEVIQDLAGLAKEAGFKYLALHALDSNAERFYLKNGFFKLSELDDDLDLILSL